MRMFYWVLAAALVACHTNEQEPTETQTTEETSTTDTSHTGTATSPSSTGHTGFTYTTDFDLDGTWSGLCGGGVPDSTEDDYFVGLNISETDGVITFSGDMLRVDAIGVQDPYVVSGHGTLLGREVDLLMETVYVYGQGDLDWMAALELVLTPEDKLEGDLIFYPYNTYSSSSVWPCVLERNL